MKKLFRYLMLFAGAAGYVAAAGAPCVHADDFKGNPDPALVSLSAMTGMGVIDNHVGLALIGAASAKIVQRGFVPDINNDVWIEAEVGPDFISGTAAFIYSAHLRWDFIKDPMWTLYALGGLGGNITPDSLGGRFELFPRFGVGALLYATQNLSVRAELSHELIVAGVQFGL